MQQKLAVGSKINVFGYVYGLHDGAFRMTQGQEAFVLDCTQNTPKDWVIIHIPKLGGRFSRFEAHLNQCRVSGDCTEMDS